MVEEIRFYRATGPYGYLSNLYRRSIEFEGMVFSCSETAYQFGKPRDINTARWLISAPKAHLCAAAAHSLFAFDIRPEWNNIKVDRMRSVLRAKFSQHPDLKILLLKTGDAILIEESTMDAFWGIGKKGTGKNMLGNLLMDIRQELSLSLRPPEESGITRPSRENCNAKTEGGCKNCGELQRRTCDEIDHSKPPGSGGCF